MKVAVDTRRIQTEQFSFRPNALTQRFGVSVNPAVQMAKVTWSARLFIGFNVGKKQVWTLPKVVKLVKSVRAEQGEDPDATFFATHGLYTEHRQKRKRLISENGCQVVILNFGKSQAVFQEQMINLAEVLADQMKQDKIFVEIQRNGLSKGVWEVTP